MGFRSGGSRAFNLIDDGLNGEIRLDCTTHTHTHTQRGGGRSSMFLRTNSSGTAQAALT